MNQNQGRENWCGLEVAPKFPEMFCFIIILFSGSGIFGKSWKSKYFGCILKSVSKGLFFAARARPSSARPGQSAAPNPYVRPDPGQQKKIRARVGRPGPNGLDPGPAQTQKQRTGWPGLGRWRALILITMLFWFRCKSIDFMSSHFYKIILSFLIQMSPKVFKQLL